MTEKEVLVGLFVDIGVAFQKAAEMLSSSTEAPVETTTTTAPAPTKEEPKAKPDTEGFGLAGMSAKDAMSLVTETEDEATLKAIGAEEKARGSKARKGVMTAIQGKLNKLKNPPAQAEVVDQEKAFTTTNPATAPADVKLFTAQFGKMTEDQRNKYFNGEIDSLGNSLVENTTTPASNESEGEFEDLGFDAPAETAAPSITAEDLRAKLQAYAKANGPEKAYAVLAHFGVKKIKDLDPSKYGEVAMELE